MGQELFYCCNCSVRLTSAQFDSGQAIRLQDRVACKDCIGVLFPELSPEERAVLDPRRTTTGELVRL